MYTDTHTTPFCYQYASSLRLIGEGYHQFCMGILGSDRGTIFTIQCYIERTDTVLFDVTGLQLQAFDHPRLNTAIVVAHGQQARGALGAE